MLCSPKNKVCVGNLFADVFILAHDALTTDLHANEKHLNTPSSNLLLNQDEWVHYAGSNVSAPWGRVLGHWHGTVVHQAIEYVVMLVLQVTC